MYYCTYVVCALYLDIVSCMHMLYAVHSAGVGNKLQVNVWCTLPPQGVRVVFL